MRDHRFKDIVKEVRKELPKAVPEFVVWWICRFFLKQMFKIMHERNARLIIKDADINQVYKDYNIKEETGRLADLDETREQEKTYPLFRRGRYPKTIHYPRCGPNPLYKRKSG